MRENHRRHRKYYLVPLFEGVGRSKKQRFSGMLKVPNGCKYAPHFVYSSFVGSGGNWPTHYKGHEIVGWHHVYCGDSYDDYSPIISLKRTEYTKTNGFIERLIRFVFG